MKTVELDCRKTDRYGRSVCRVHVARYRDYARKQTAQERDQYEFAGQEAQAKGVGLWSGK